MGQHADRFRSRLDRHKSAKSRKGQPREKKATDKRERYYHCYDEPDYVRITIDINFIRNIVECAMAQNRTVSMRKFLYDRGLKIYYRTIKRGSGYLYLKNIRQFCKIFNIDLNELEQKGIILNPRLHPVDMHSKEFIKLKSHVLNEGRIAFLKQSVGILNYSNQDPVLLRYFTDIVKKLRGNITGPYLATHALAINAIPALARALDASGLSSGRKTKTNPSLDLLLKEGSELFKYHIRATLTEEGWCSLSIQHHSARFEIAWGRSVDITDKLSRDQIEELRGITKELGKRKIPIKSVKDPEIRKIIGQNPPRSFDQEVALLIHVHKEKQLHEGFPTRVHLSKEDRITAFWEIHFTRPDLVDLIHDEYGMLPSTWKARRLERLYETYVKYRGRRLTDEEIQEVRKVKEENPPKITAEWISKKMQELFPDVEWGGDLERIRRLLGRKESE